MEYKLKDNVSAEDLVNLGFKRTQKWKYVGNYTSRQDEYCFNYVDINLFTREIEFPSYADDEEDVRGVAEDIYLLTKNNLITGDYEKPILLDDNTKQFLKLIDYDYNLICRISENEYVIEDDFYSRHNFKINSANFKIDLSMLEINKEYSISDLLGDD